MTKIKTFINNLVDSFDDDDVNEFMKDKNVLDVKLSECNANNTVMVIYKENENENN